jgi:hypothetical protein
MACVIENYPIPFTAVVTYVLSNGEETNSTITGTWTGTTYSSYVVELTENAI